MERLARDELIDDELIGLVPYSRFFFFLIYDDDKLCELIAVKAPLHSN
jgi:hypothetical protein